MCFFFGGGGGGGGGGIAGGLEGVIFFNKVSRTY